MVLDGRKTTQIRLERMLFWDVNNGVARRAWAGNENARLALDIARENECRYEWTDAHWASEETLKDIEKLYCIVCWKCEAERGVFRVGWLVVRIGRLGIRVDDWLLELGGKGLGIKAKHNELGRGFIGMITFTIAHSLLFILIRSDTRLAIRIVIIMGVYLCSESYRYALGLETMYCASHEYGKRSVTSRNIVLKSGVFLAL